MRQRKEDIPLLVEYIIDRYARKAGKNIKRVNRKTPDLLQSYAWPGNVRELRYVIERSVIVCDTQDLSIDESWLRKRPSELRPENPLALPEKMAAHEKEIIEAALRESGGQGLRTFGSGRQIGYATIDLGVKDTIAENK